MALPSWVSQGTVVATSTTAPAGYPSSFIAGDLLLLFVSSDSSSISTAVTGFTSLGSVQTGGGITVAAWSKVATGSETGTVSVSITGGTKGVAYMVAYRSGGTGGLSASLYRGGSDTDTSSTAYLATGSSWTLATDDKLAAFTTMLAAGTFSASATGISLASAGSTLASATQRFGARAGTNTLYYNHWDASVTVGGTGTPSVSGTGVGANASGSTAFVAIREVANTPPTVSADGGNQTVPAGAVANLSFTASDSDGTIVSRATTFDYPTSGAPTLTGGTTSTPSFTTGAAGSLYVVRHTVTDNAGATGFTTVEVRVPATTLTSVTPVETNGSGSGWSRVGSAGTDGQALGDADTSTYVESGNVTGSEQEYAIRMPPLPAGITSLSFKLNLRVDTAGSAQVKIRLRSGGPTATVLQEWTQGSLTTTDTQYGPFTVTSPESITDTGSIYVSVAATS